MIRVFSKDEMDKLYADYPDDTTPVISISDVGYESPVPESHPMCLRLYFDDVTEYHVTRGLAHPYYRQQFLHRDPVYFTAMDAVDVINFLSKASASVSKGALFPKLYIHCYKGMSRSIALAIYAELFTEFGDSSFFMTDKFQNSIANSDVLRNMLIMHCKLKGDKNEI